MINQDYYAPKNIKTILGVSYYPAREATIVTETANYVLRDGDDLYSISKSIFGNNGQSNWTIIADINSPDVEAIYSVGDTIKLPKTIVL